MMRLSTARAALAALAFAAPLALAQKAPAATDVPIPDIPYTKFVLKNGLTVIVHEDHKLPVVAINTWYHVGSKNEKPGKTGFAHLFEHLMFSGSENFNQTYISALLGIGATDLNGTTSKDRTNYFQNVPTSMLDYVLFAESDRMGHLLGVLDQKKLDLQRGVVQNEKRSGENQPYGIVRDLVPPNTYPPEHPYSWTIIGSMADLDAASMKDVQEWFKTYYGPNNTILVLAGDITPEQARQKVEKYYGDIPPGPPIAKQAAWPAKMTGTHRGLVQDRVPQARIYRIWNVPGIPTKEDALFDVAAQILGGGKTSRLYKRLVRQDQLAVDAVAFNNSSEIGGQFNMQLTARPGADVRKMEAAADEELQALLKSGPTQAEVDLARTTILADYARRAERIGGFGGKSDLLAQCQTFHGNPECWKDYVRVVKTATPAVIHRAMKEWLSDGDYVLEVQPYPQVAAASAALDRKAGPELGKAQVLKMPELQKLTLSNGLKVLVAERHTAPVVNLSLLVDSGYAADPQDLPGLTNLVLHAMEEGTPTRSATKISEELERLGATLETSANLDGSFVAMNALKTTLGPALDIYADVILHPAFPPGEVDRLRKEQLAGIAREKASPEASALRVMPSLLYGSGHAYSRPLTGTGTEAAVSRMTRDDLVKYHRTWFRPNNATLLVVGDTTAAQVKPMLEKAFAGWNAAEVPKKNLAAVKPPEKVAVYLLDRPGSQQSVIVGGQVAQPADATELVQMQLVNNVLGGTFSSRMNMNLREDKHWSYGVYSQLRAALGQRPLVSVSAVQSDKTSEAFREVVNEYAGVAGARPITAAELKVAQDRETLALPGRFETTVELSKAYANVLQYRLPEDYYTRITPTVLAFTPDQANALARKFLLPNQQVWVVVGDMAKVEAGIRALNVGEVHRIDADGKILK
ncbi:M16 family metallopeptidase [Ramlibacter sp. PS4R-6]|uniref:M16 family metallopeptidase n=1 Tax=Ramlibacter sp. PS4R-6 TaxID=3133438 RepID=UPI00309F7EF6